MCHACVCTEAVFILVLCVHRLAPVGTMLRVRGVQFIADGRSMVDAVGGKRFKVVQTVCVCLVRVSQSLLVLMRF